MKKLKIILLFIIISNFFIISLNAQNQLTDQTEQIDRNSRTIEHNRAKRKIRSAKTLTENGIKHFLKVSVEDACYDFIYNPVWRDGEIFVFVFDEKGNCLAYGDDMNLIWKNISRVKSVGDIPLIKHMLRVGEKGAIIGYLWDNAYNSSYVKTIVKNGKRYVLGAGFYPQGNEYTTKDLVKSAVAYFNAYGKEETFALINNLEGPFVKGDIYMFAYDFNGVCVAHGENPALIGQNLIKMVDSRGQPLIQNLIKIAKTKGSGWLDYYWLNALKRSYIERIVDPKTKKPYLISAGYYPNQTLQTAQSLVNRAISFLKANGARVAFSEFSNKVGQFIEGGLSIFAYNMNGKCLANGDNPGFVGQNLINRTDQQGKFIVKEMIKVAKKDGKGVVSAYLKNAFTIMYIIKVDIPDGKFIVGTQYHPDTKIQAVETMVEKAAEHLKTHPDPIAFRDFSSRDGGFIHGDLRIFVYDTEGTRYANGLHKDQIWRNFSKTTDQAGKPVIENVITTAINGGGWVQYRTRNAVRRVYVQLVEKNTKAGQKTYAIGSGYFT